MIVIDRTAVLDGLYRLSLRAAKRRLALTLAEAKCILDACNGIYITHEMLGQHLRMEVQDAIRLNALDTKWSIDGASLVSRLRELPQPLSAAVEIWTSDFWSSEQLNQEDFERAHYALMVDVELEGGGHGDEQDK